MRLRRLGMIGAGGMAETVLGALAGELSEPLDDVALLVRPAAQSQAAALLDRIGPRIARRICVATGVGALLSTAPELVVECAGHGAVRQYGEAVLGGACDLAVISVGALADDELRAALLSAAKRQGARLVLPAGAVGGIDALRAARLSGLHAVHYTGRKPPLAWRGSAAERAVDLDAITTPVVFFEGTARQAAIDYPQNANVAATVAIAGLGFDATRIRLIADPSASHNVHEITVQAGCGDFELKFAGHPSPSNPKTSLLAGLSVAREILNRHSALVV
jgi:aspartate dehydrogenase